MSSDDYCDICKGKGKNMFEESCPYCNGTGEWNASAQAYLKNHICQCIFLDRKFCPVCSKKCHHDSSLNPKQIIVPGGDGAAPTKNYKTEATMSPKDDELIISMI